MLSLLSTRYSSFCYFNTFLRCATQADNTDDAKNICDGLDSCTYHGHNGIGGDPCAGVVKYTTLRWKCYSPTTETMCAYLTTSATENNWKTTSCFETEAFACTVPAGQGINQFPKPITKKCPPFSDPNFAWQLNSFSGKCYLFPRNFDNINYSGKYDEGAQFCKENNGLLATIHSDQENSWLTAHVNDDMWIGIKGTSSSNGIPTTWTSDGSEVDFNAFWSNGPVLGEGLILSHLADNGYRGHWFAQNISDHNHPPLCMTDALPGAPDPPEVPTAPPNEFCDPGWHAIINEVQDVKCVKVQSSDKTWQAASDLCQSEGATLMSINSPKDQEVSLLFSLYPTAIGK